MDDRIEFRNGTPDFYSWGPKFWPDHVEPEIGNDFCGIELGCRNPELISIRLNELRLNKGDTLSVSLTYINRDDNEVLIPLIIRKARRTKNEHYDWIDIDRTVLPKSWSVVRKQIVLDNKTKLLEIGISNKFCQDKPFKVRNNYVLIDCIELAKRRNAEYTLP